MANTIRLKRRATGGSAGAPASLATTEPAYNEVDDVLYLGKGDNGSGVATSVIPIAGKGAFADLSSNQTIGGVKTFSSDVIVPGEAYGPGWNGSNEAPTKNDVYDQMESISAAGVSDGDKGDITVSSSGSVWEIDADAVTNAKLANMASKTYKGRTSALAGNPEDVSVADLKTDLALVKADVGLGNVDNTSDANKPVSTAQQTALDLKANLASPTFTGTPAVPTAAAGTNTTQAASTAYVITEIAARLATGDFAAYKGAIDASSNPNYPAANAGDTYRISVAGKIGGGSGPNVEAGDLIMSHVDSSAGGTHASVGADWDIIQTNIDGAVTLTGTQTLTNKTIALGSNTISGTIAQFNTALTDADFATLSGTETLDNKTISGGTF
jgi:hypothetical protein